MLTSLENFHSLPCPSQAEKVWYPLTPAVSPCLPVPKKSAAIEAALLLVMPFISTSTPMVWFFISLILLSVAAFIVFSSVFFFVFVTVY